MSRRRHKVNKNMKSDNSRTKTSVKRGSKYGKQNKNYERTCFNFFSLSDFLIHESKYKNLLTAEQTNIFQDEDLHPLDPILINTYKDLLKLPVFIKDQNKFDRDIEHDIQPIIKNIKKEIDYSIENESKTQIQSPDKQTCLERFLESEIKIEYNTNAPDENNYFFNSLYNNTRANECIKIEAFSDDDKNNYDEITSESNLLHIPDIKNDSTIKIINTYHLETNSSNFHKIPYCYSESDLNTLEMKYANNVVIQTNHDYDSDIKEHRDISKQISNDYDCKEIKKEPDCSDNELHGQIELECNSENVYKLPIITECYSIDVSKCVSNKIISDEQSNNRKFLESELNATDYKTHPSQKVTDHNSDNERCINIHTNSNINQNSAIKRKDAVYKSHFYDKRYKEFVRKFNNFRSNGFVSKKKLSDEKVNRMRPIRENIHKETLSLNSSYRCDTCESVFSEEFLLNIHIESHNTVKPFKCIICNKCFVREELLINHYNIHTDGNKYECDLCYKIIVGKPALESHISTHSSSKT
ncbi:zinc finger protein 836-like [Ctenocephalides felis]|uniref:zinc finger protein 836-like n=1 Tax=Ctenocephalides felis TaxID=7515 RepID=UPI000E6E3032|nr:zinc finger protein 836-like [Ctenocephalides felis]